MPRTRRQLSQQTAISDTAVSGNSLTVRRSTRAADMEKLVKEETAAIKHEEHDSDEGEDEDEATENVYVLDGETFTNYQDFVDAKRKRNQAVLMKLGFGPDMSNKRLKIGSDGGTNTATKRGLKSNKSKYVANAPPLRSRKSSRISGDRTKLVALDMYVNDWHRDNTATIVTKDGEGGDDSDEEEEQETFFKGRVNDGSTLSVKDAIELNEPKWIHDDSEENADRLLKELVSTRPEKSWDSTMGFSPGTTKPNRNDDRKTKSPTSVMSTSWECDLTAKIDALSIDKEEWVCKVTPDRIYSVATHPSESKLICCAGDKQGYIGLWDVDGISTSAVDSKKENENNGIVSLFRIHSRPICCLEWLNNESMVTASYDGSVRRMNAETGTFDEIFATYDESDTTYLEDLGYGLDQGYRYWTQSVTTDHRSKGASNPCLFVSTSVGDVFHIDLRVSEKQKITFHETVSEKKINSVRYVFCHENVNPISDFSCSFSTKTDAFLREKFPLSPLGKLHLQSSSKWNNTGRLRK